MSYRTRCWLSALFTAVLTTPCPAETTSSSTRPNIVFIISDDHRWDCIGAAGNPHLKTSHLDELAREGVHFTQGTIFTPQCSPSRAQLLTGLPGHSSGWYSNQTQHRSRRDANGFKDLPTLPVLLKNSGYRTVLVGKWHLAPDPWNVGFTDVRTWLPKGAGKYKDLEMAKGNTRQVQVVPGFAQDVFGQDAAAFISTPQAKEKPFLLWLALTAPHTPLKPNPDPIVDLYKQKKNAELAPPHFTQGTPDEQFTSFTVYAKRKAAKGTTATARRQRETDWHNYYAAITSLDEQVGRVKDALEQSGLEKKTIIVFVGDNGMMRGSRGWDGKVLPYEESVRVPFIVYAPGIATHKGASRAAVSSLDLSPSFLKWAGAEVPPSWPGRDLTPALQSDNPESFDHAVSEFADNVSEKFGSVEYRTIRTPEAKLIRWRDPAKGEEFFDLKNDPRELRNQVANPAMKDRVEALRQKLDEWQKKTNDRPQPNQAELVTGEGED